MVSTSSHRSGTSGRVFKETSTTAITEITIFRSVGTIIESGDGSTFIVCSSINPFSPISSLTFNTSISKIRVDCAIVDIGNSGTSLIINPLFISTFNTDILISFERSTISNGINSNSSGSTGGSINKVEISSTSGTSIGTS